MMNKQIPDTQNKNSQYISLRLGSISELNPQKTFDCGQCFRWNETDRGDYIGVAGNNAAIVRVVGHDIFLSGTGSRSFWRDYFDLRRDYAAISHGFEASGEYMRACIENGRGIRILRQDSWEALCSFIISQCNNIPRIKKIIETMCELFGEAISFNGKRLYTFPSAERLSALSEDDLSPLRAGYRAAYIISAARALHNRELHLEGLRLVDRESAIASLSKLPGVGRKVSSCVALYGLGIMSGFPVDTWMKRALREHFSPDFDPNSFGEYAGLAQQYIFHFARNSGK